MHLSLLLKLGSLALAPISSAQAPGGEESCCKFTISSQKFFPLPAGQLEDGQIRFNGSYPATNFCLNNSGGIIDDSGFGCIVAGPPETQIQCDHGKSPDTGFSVGANNSLMYKGSPDFFACPATDTEYNIYVSPNFGQDKCFPINITTSGCGTSAPPTTNLTCPPPRTIWQTRWVTETIPITATYTVDTTTLTTCLPTVTGNMTTAAGWNGTRTSISM